MHRATVYSAMSDIDTNGAVIESTKWTQPRCDFCSGKLNPPMKSELACGLAESREKGLFL